MVRERLPYVFTPCCRGGGELERASHPGVESRAIRKSISHRCHLLEVAFVWELTQAEKTVHLSLGCLQGGESGDASEGEMAVVGGGDASKQRHRTERAVGKRLDKAREGKGERQMERKREREMERERGRGKERLETDYCFAFLRSSYLSADPHSVDVGLLGVEQLFRPLRRDRVRPPLTRGTVIST